MSRYIFSKNNRWYISEVFDPSDSKLQEKASYYTLTDDVRGPYYAVGTSDSASIGVSYVPVVEPAGASLRAGVVVSDSGTLYVQPLGFDGTTPYDSDSLQSFEHLQIFNTGYDEPAYGGVSAQNVNKGAFMVLTFSNSTGAYTDSGNDVAKIGSPSFTVIDGVPCIHCNGTGLKVELQQAANLYNLGTFSISYWLKSSQSVGRDGLCLVSSTGWQTGKDLALGFNMSTSQGQQYYTFSADSNWHHYVLTSNNRTCKVYVDGIYRDTFTMSAPSMSTEGRLFIGGISDGWSTSASTFGQYKDVYISNVRMFYTQVSAAQALQLYNQLHPTT